MSLHGGGELDRRHRVSSQEQVWWTRREKMLTEYLHTRHSIKLREREIVRERERDERERERERVSE